MCFLFCDAVLSFVYFCFKYSVYVVGFVFLLSNLCLCFLLLWFCFYFVSVLFLSATVVKTLGLKMYAVLTGKTADFLAFI